MAIEGLLKDTGAEASDASLDEISDPKERLKILLKRRLAEAVKLERYEEAQRIQKEALVLAIRISYLRIDYPPFLFNQSHKGHFCISP